MDKSVFDAALDTRASAVAASAAAAITPQAWCDLILRRCGLAFRNTRLPDVIGVVREEMRARGVVNEAAYYQRLTGPADSGADWDALIERLINHETSFFRHPPSFDVLRKQILPELRDARGRRGRLNLWSAGCSTGQEAYSLAMLAMADEALKGEFTVWGGDISRYAIDTARRGRYGARAVATVPDDYRQRFLRTVGTGPATEYEVADELRQRVRFMVTNLVGADGFSASHDVIFCHNVLIYFSPAAVTQAVAFLASRLTLGGYLLLGPGEAPNERPRGLAPVNVSGVRAFQRRSARPSEGRA
ncbi:MAG TPA: CheR family methyltransferase [Vicinamibacterales bacterium]|nr:CheR family methyltransferase [Vicinamibacterales bacterium]